MSLLFIISSVNKEVLLLFFFPNLDAFTFSCLVTLAGTSSTWCLIWNGKKRTSLFCFWSWEKNIQTFIIKFDISYRFFAWMTVIRTDKFFSLPILHREQLLRWILTFVNALVNLLKVICSFSFKFISLVSYIELFSNVKPALHSWDSSHPAPPPPSPRLFPQPFGHGVLLFYIYEPGLLKYFFQIFLHLFSWMLLIL